MDRLAVQYLEDGPGVRGIAPVEARARLRAAFETLPITEVLLGWNLPEKLVEACAREADRASARLYRWHPLLTGDGTFAPRPGWQSIGLRGDPIPGFQEMPEFTFVCPNRPAVQAAVLDHLRGICATGYYDGIFLDRLRYPSPARSPDVLLSCFCDDCRRVAEADGLDLDAARQHVVELLSQPRYARSAVRFLLDRAVADAALAEPGLSYLRAILEFRTQTVSRFVCEAVGVIREAGLEVGLDCFSPSLSYMVGQDLGALDFCCDWIKIMSYAHALGPAGLPFEIRALTRWLVERHAIDEPDGLACVSKAAHLPLPIDVQALATQGLSSTALAAEVRRARSVGISQLLVGIELVEIEGVSRLDPERIVADLRAVQSACPDGLVLSWDLWHIPLERLVLVRQAWDQA
jgi:hypothetical protein